MRKKFYAKEETLEKVKQLDGKKLINKDGQEGKIEYILKVRPFSDDYNEGDIVTVLSKEEHECIEFVYRGEEGLQMLLENWRVADE